MAERVLAETKSHIESAGVTPGLAVILVGDDAPSHLYVRLKERAAHDVGIHFEKIVFSADVREQEVLAVISQLNRRADIHGIIVQLPLPKHLSVDRIIQGIDPTKDTDGFHQETLTRFFRGDADACPVFPRAVSELLRAARGYYIGEKGLVVANSQLLGRVMAQMLSLEGLDSKYVLSSSSPEELVRQTLASRVVVTACGIPRLIIGDMIAPDSIIIDGGISHIEGKVVGDVESQSVQKKARFVSPVPGGVGPVTVAALLSRVTDAALKKVKK